MKLYLNLAVLCIVFKFGSSNSKKIWKMKLYLNLAVLCIVFVAINAETPGGLNPVGQNDPTVKEAMALVLRELQDKAKTIPGSPSVTMSDFTVRRQVVAGTLYHMSFKANYAYPTGKKVTKSCDAKVFKPLGANSNLELTGFTDPKEKIQCF